MRELNDLRKNPSEGIRVQTNEEDMLDVTGIIEGPGASDRIIVDFNLIDFLYLGDPEGTPYAGGYFKVKFKFTEEFPAAPPKCTSFYIHQ